MKKNIFFINLIIIISIILNFNYQQNHNNKKTINYFSLFKTKETHALSIDLNNNSDKKEKIKNLEKLIQEKNILLKNKAIEYQKELQTLKQINNDLLKERLKNTNFQQKEEFFLKINEKINSLNQKSIDHFINIYEKLNKIFLEINKTILNNNSEEKFENQLKNVENKLETLKNNILEQNTKLYTLNFDEEKNIKTNIKTTITLLKDDLKKINTLIIEIKKELKEIIGQIKNKNQ